MTNSDRPDRSGEEPAAWLSGLSDEELHEVAASGSDLPAALARARLRWFAESRTYSVGWLLTAEGNLDIDAAWVAVPPKLIAALGAPGAADDMVEFAPVGSPEVLTSIRASWYVYNADELGATVVVRDREGREWTLQPSEPGVYGADLPADLARPVEGAEPPSYEIDVEVSIAPLAPEIEDIDRIDGLVIEWFAELGGRIGVRLGDGGGDVRIVAFTAAAATRGDGGLQLPEEVADRLGVYPHVSWAVDGTDLVVVVVPDPDAETDGSGRLVVAGVAADGTVLAAGRLAKGTTSHICRLPVGDPELVTRVVVGELGDG